MKMQSFIKDCLRLTGRVSGLQPQIDTNTRSML